MFVRHSEGCAWRATYLYTGRNPGARITPGYPAVQIAHIGIDPSAGRGPTLFGGIRSLRIDFNLRIPHVTWAMTYRFPRITRPLWRAQERLLHRLDGRYGSRVGR